VDKDEYGALVETRSTQRKTCPTATLSTSNLIRTELWSNPGLRGVEYYTESKEL